MIAHRLISFCARSVFHFLLVFLTLAGAALSAQSPPDDDTVLEGWRSPSGPGGLFSSPTAACEAQWEKFHGSKKSSRFIGAFQRDDDQYKYDCQWTRWQYQCPEPGQAGNTGNCGTIIPGYVLRVCPTGYYATGDGYCRLEAARERECADPCNNNGKPNPKTANPIIVSSGSKYLEALDYASADGLFRIARQYRSFQVGRAIQQSVLPRTPMRGLNAPWSFEFNREIQLGIFSGSPAAPNAKVAVILPDGTAYGFELQADGTWQEDATAQFSSSSGNLKLEHVGALPSDLATFTDTSSTWRLTDRNDTVWTLETRVGLNGGRFVRGWPTVMEKPSGCVESSIARPA
ncbi:MAG: hypothetical protein AAF553_00905 [Pseudomonadota bacterium]